MERRKGRMERGRGEVDIGDDWVKAEFDDLLFSMTGAVTVSNYLEPGDPK